MGYISLLGMPHFGSSRVGDSLITIWCFHRNYCCWIHHVRNLYSSSEVVSYIQKSAHYWALLFCCKKSTRISLAASASISPLTPYSSNPSIASLVVRRSSWSLIGIHIMSSSFLMNSLTLFPCLDIVPSILYGIPIMIISAFLSCIHFGSIVRRSDVDTVFHAKQNPSTE